MGKNWKWKFVALTFLLFFGFALGVVFKSYTKSKFSIGHGYLLVKKGSVNELCYPPKGKVISGVQEVVVKNGIVFGIMQNGSYFSLEKDKIKYFPSYADQLRFASQKGVVIYESDYLKFL